MNNHPFYNHLFVNCMTLVLHCRTLFWEEMPSLHDLSQEEIQQQFNSKIPVSILENDNLMERLTTAATRLEHLQVVQHLTQS